MVTVIDNIAGADGRSIEITIEPGEIALVVRSPDHERPERVVLSWDEFHGAADRLNNWLPLIKLEPKHDSPPDEIAAFVAKLGQ